jgi:hypothetical protein
MDTPDTGGIELDAASHRYSWDGRPVGGVTEIIQALGLVEARWYSDYSRERGTAVHAALELLAMGRLDWTSVDPRIIGYVRAGERFVLDAGIPIGECLTEHLVYHEARRYAGKLDLFAKAYGAPAVIDFKSGGLGCAGIQLAAYEEALRIERGDVRPYRRMAVQLRDDGTYRKTDYRDFSDYAEWAACCLIFNKYHLPRRKTDAD